jgi:hypothetical protein
MVVQSVAKHARVFQVKAKPGEGSGARDTFDSDIREVLAAHPDYVESILLVNGRWAMLIALLKDECQDPGGFIQANQGSVLEQSEWQVHMHHRA